MRKALLAFVLISGPALADTAQVGTGGLIFITPTGGMVNSVICGLPGGQPFEQSGGVLGEGATGHPPPIVHGSCYNVFQHKKIPIKEGWPYNPGIFANQLDMLCSIDADRMGFTCHIH